MGSNERSGLPLTTRETAICGVWVDLAVLFGHGGSAGAQVDGIDTNQPAPGGLTRWLRTSDGAWIGRVTYIATMRDGSTIKLPDQLVPAAALRPR